MTITNDSVSQWTRQLAQLRARALKPGNEGFSRDLAEAALSMCESLLRALAGATLECDRLRAEVRTSDADWEDLFDIMLCGCLSTNAAGVILNANRAASVLLNLDAKRLRDRDLVVFVEDRELFRTLVRQLGASDREEVRATLTFRPRERKPAAMHVVVKRLPTRESVWLWFLTPAITAESTGPKPIAPEGEALAG